MAGDSLSSQIVRGSTLFDELRIEEDSVFPVAQQLPDPFRALEIEYDVPATDEGVVLDGDVGRRARGARPPDTDLSLRDKIDLLGGRIRNLGQDLLRFRPQIVGGFHGWNWLLPF